MRICVVCGCTEELACEGGCHWVRKMSKSKGICSLCPIPLPDNKLTKYQLASRAQIARRVQRMRQVLERAFAAHLGAARRYREVNEEARAYERALQEFQE